MNTNTIIHRCRYGKLHFIKLPATLPVSFSMLDNRRCKPAGYFSTLTHEVRNPLSNINLACDALNLTNLDEEQRICLKIIMRGTERINGLINILLLRDQPAEQTL